MFAVDHVVATTRSLDDASAAWKRLGFTLTPRGFHPFGTMNNLVMFTSTFFELFAMRDPQAFDAAVEAKMMPADLAELTRVALATRDGPSLLALTTDRPEEDLARAEGAGIRVRSPLHFKRPVTLPDGRDTVADVTVRFLAARSRDTPPVFLSVQHNREAVWVPEWQRHPNGALEILEIVYSADRFESVVPHLSALLARHRGPRGDDDVLYDAGAAKVRVTKPDGWLRRFGEDAETSTGASLEALVIAVADLDRLREILADNGVPYRLTPDACQVGRSSTFGTLVEFVQARSNPAS